MRLDIYKVRTPTKGGSEIIYDCETGIPQDLSNDHFKF